MAIQGVFTSLISFLSILSQRPLTVRSGLSQRGWGSHRKAGHLTEWLGLSQSGWTSHRQVGHLTVRPGPLIERPRPFTERPGPLTEKPGPLRERPGPFKILSVLDRCSHVPAISECILACEERPQLPIKWMLLKSCYKYTS